MFEPKVSIIVPVYNAEEFLEDCIKSIIYQSLEDIEVICINDGSSDNSLDILNNFQEKDNRIKIFSQENSGPAAARNLGLEKSSGEYILFVDGDDWIEPDMCEKLYEHAIHNNSDLILFDATEHKLNNEFRNRIYFPHNSFKEDYANFTFDYKYNKKLVLNYFLVVWSKMYKRDFVKNIRFPNFPIFEDIQFHVESMLLAKKISYFPELFYHYRKINVNSEQNFKVKTDKTLVITDVFLKIEEFLIENNFFDEFKINFFIFALSESRNSLNNINLVYKQELFSRIKSFFNTFDVNSEDLDEIPFELHSLYMHIINADNYFDYERFQNSEHISLNENEELLFNLILQKNKVISQLEQKLYENKLYDKINQDFLNKDDINFEAYHKIKEMNLFDEEYYKNHEGYFGTLDPLMHYIYVGYEEGKNPCEIFNSNYYLNYFDDVKKSGLNPLVYFVMYGLYEGKIKIREDVWQPPLVLNKFDADKKLVNLNDLSLNNQERLPRLIVSLTSFPERMDRIKYALFSLFDQSLKADKIILWLAESQFPNNEDDLPLDVLKFIDYGLEIKWCDDIKSYKKLIPSLKEFPNDIIVTFDDDIYVDHDLLEKLYSYHLKYPNYIIANRIRKISLDDRDHSLKNYDNWELSLGEQNASYLNFFTGSGGVLYPPHSLDDKVFDLDLAKRLTPTGDDIWFWAMAVKKSTKIKVISDNAIFGCFISPERELGLLNDYNDTLWALNSNNLNNTQMDNVLDEFPEIKERLVNDYIQDKFLSSLNKKYYYEIKFNSNPNKEDIKVAAIMDEFTFDSYKYECNLINLTPDNWVDVFKKEKPDFFFCESAFHGLKTKNHPKGVWVDKIHTHLNDDYENREILFEILDYCNNNNIPTVFWNKEDPTSFYEEMYNFVDTALHFDYIFTTAEECISKYKARGHDNVHCLMFATQPKLFNPINIGDRTNDVIFAGSWYQKFADRCNVMKLIFDKLLENNFNIKIYDRMFELGYDIYTYPLKYQKFVNAGVDYNHMPLVYKESRFGLNINTVTDSPSMFARRVFELMSSNTLVFSNYSKAVSLLFGNNVIFLDKDINLSDYDFNKICEDNLYDVLENHTYLSRFNQILDTIEINHVSDIKYITLFYELNDSEDIRTIINHFKLIDYDYKNLKVILPSNISKDRFSNIISIDDLIYKSDFENYNFSDDENHFFGFVNLDINPDFIKKALLSYNYLPIDIGIKTTQELSKKYTFSTRGSVPNIVCNNLKFKEFLDYYINDKELNDFHVYYI